MGEDTRTTRVGVVTGASRGVGRSTAAHLVAEGWSVGMVARDADALEAAVREMRAGPGRALACPGDVADPDAVRAACERVRASLGPPTALINNAARILPVGPFVSLDPLEWKRTLDVNVLGVVLWTRAVAEGMARCGRGTVLNLVSGMGLRVFPRFSAYAASKAAVVHLTRVLAEELKPRGVTVNALDPGLVGTEMQATLRALPVEAVGEPMRKALRDYARQGMLKPPEQIGAWIASFLAGRAFEITGEVATLGEYRARHGIPTSPAERDSGG